MRIYELRVKPKTFGETKENCEAVQYE